MSVSPDEVRRVAELARLALGSDEIDALAADLSRILEHVDALAGDGELEDASAVPEPGADSTGAHQDADAPGPDPLARGPAAFAPDFVEGHFTVPRVVSRDATAAVNPETTE